MANTINLCEKYLDFVDELYIKDACTSILEGSNQVIKASKEVAGTVYVANVAVSKLGDFSRAGSETGGPFGGYTLGSMENTWEPITLDKERSIVIPVDRLNVEEVGIDVSAANTLSRVIKYSVIPEVDACRISSLVQTAVSKGNVASGSMTSGEDVVRALRAGINNFESNEVGSEWILFIKGAYLGALQDMNNLYPREVLSAFSDVITVPDKRMYSKIDLTQSGYTKAQDAVDVDFVIVAKDAVVSYLRQFLKAIGPDQSVVNDSWNFFYRNEQIFAHVLKNKENGVYAHLAE